MTWSQKYTENKQLLKRYHAYLPHIKSDTQQLQLVTEIKRLTQQNVSIQQLSLTAYQSHILSTTLQFTSKLCNAT